MLCIDEIRTEHLLLTRVRENDRTCFLEMYQDPSVMATMGGVRTTEQSSALFALDFGHWEQYGFGRWVARDSVTGQFVGRGGLRHCTVEGKNAIELGYAFLPQYWGRGLATELAEASVRVGFDVIRLDELICMALPSNGASRRVMEKAGFRYDREVIHAELRHFLHRQTASEWRERRAAGQAKVGDH